MSRGLSRPDAEDCAQETVLILVRKYPGKDEADAVPLAFRIIRWKLWEHRRRRTVLGNRSAIPIDEIVSGREGVDGGGNPEEIAALKEAVHGALDRIGKKVSGDIVVATGRTDGRRDRSENGAKDAQRSLHRPESLQEAFPEGVRVVAAATLEKIRLAGVGKAERVRDYRPSFRVEGFLNHHAVSQKEVADARGSTDGRPCRR